MEFGQFGIGGQTTAWSNPIGYVDLDLFVKAVASDNGVGGRVVIVTTDLIAIPLSLLQTNEILDKAVIEFAADPPALELIFFCPDLFVRLPWLGPEPGG